MSGDSNTECFYGISRIEDAKFRTLAWRVSLCRRGERLVKNFPDKKYGGKKAALCFAQIYRDRLLKEHPPLTRKEFSNASRSNNNSGITGVYTFVKTWKLKDGTVRETQYWEANWPTARGKSAHKCFSVSRYGEDVARQLAIRAREVGLRQLQGLYWASERGQLKSQTTTAEASRSAHRERQWDQAG